MTKVPSDSAEFRGASGGPAPAKGTSPLRLILLLLVFGVALIGLLYDYTVARPAIDKATQTVQDLLQQKIPDPNNDNTVTPEEVQQLLSRKPTRVEQRANCMVEVYSWRAGLPTRTYDLKVVYTDRSFPLLFSAAANDEPEYPAVTESRDQPTAEESKSFKPPRVGGVGAGGETMKRSAKAPPEGQGKPAPKPPADQPPVDEPSVDEPAKEAPPADPTAPPADPATPPADPATPPADPTAPPADPATPPADPATPPADPAAPPADPATPPADPAPAEPAEGSGGGSF